MTPAPAARPAWTEAPALRLWLAAGVTLVFAFPNLAALWYRADPLTIANESVGYRYLFSERLLNGEGSSVWVLAGFLATAIQTTWLAVLNLFSHPTPDELHWRLMAFSYGFNALIVAGTGAVFFAAARNRRLSLLDLGLLALPALGPAFTTRRSGFYYYTLPDYYHLNVLLTVVTVWLFLGQWRAERPGAVSLRRVFCLGLYVGVMGSNKITMLPIGLALLAPAVFAAPLDWRRFLTRGTLAAAGLAAGFIFVIWWFYLFKLSPVIDMFQTWLGVVRDPGGESNFWSSNFRSHLTGYSYGYIFGLYVVGVVLAAVAALRDPARRREILLVAGVAALGGATWCYFIYKRPAGTTFFEAAVALFGFTAITLVVIAHGRRMPRVIAGLLGLLVVYSAATFQWQGNLAILRESAPWARHMWQLHRDMLEFAHGQAIIVIHPLNQYGYGGVAEFLLKGTADVPSWNVTENGRPILERYSPRTTYRHDYSGPPPNSAYPGDVTLFWIDRPEFPPLATQYPFLAAATRRPGVETRSWSMPIQGERATIVAHAFRLPPEDVVQKQRTVATQPEAFTGTRVGAATIRLQWRPDGVARVALQIKSGDGEWFALRRLDPGTDHCEAGGLDPAVTYRIRARKEFEDARSEWVEVIVPPVATDASK